MRKLSPITRNTSSFKNQKSNDARMICAGNFCVPVEPKLAAAIRIRGINGVSPQVLTMLQCLHYKIFSKYV